MTAKRLQVVADFFFVECPAGARKQEFVRALDTCSWLPSTIFLYNSSQKEWRGLLASVGLSETYLESVGLGLKSWRYKFRPFVDTRDVFEALVFEPTQGYRALPAPNTEQETRRLLIVKQGFRRMPFLPVNAEDNLIFLRAALTQEPRVPLDHPLAQDQDRDALFQRYGAFSDFLFEQVRNQRHEGDVVYVKVESTLFGIQERMSAEVRRYKPNELSYIVRWKGRTAGSVVRSLERWATAVIKDQDTIGSPRLEADIGHGIFSSMRALFSVLHSGHFGLLMNKSDQPVECYSPVGGTSSGSLINDMRDILSELKKQDGWNKKSSYVIGEKHLRRGQDEIRLALPNLIEPVYKELRALSTPLYATETANAVAGWATFHYGRYFRGGVITPAMVRTAMQNLDERSGHRKKSPRGPAGDRQR